MDVDQHRQVVLDGSRLTLSRSGNGFELSVDSEIGSSWTRLTLDEARLMIAAWQPLVFIEEESHGAEATTSS